MTADRAWTAALLEHDATIARFLAAMDEIPPARWSHPGSDGAWSPAEEVLHVTLAYEFGCAAVTDGASMRLRVPRLGAWLSGHIILPMLLRRGTFPRGATSPPEVQPSADEARVSTVPAARVRLAHAAATAARLLRSAERRAPDAPVVRVTHAYFGALTPHRALRLLSAHTRHHAQRLLHQQ